MDSALAEKGPPCYHQTDALQALLRVADALICCEGPEDVPLLTTCTALNVDAPPRWVSERETARLQGRTKGVVQAKKRSHRMNKLLQKNVMAERRQAAKKHKVEHSPVALLECAGQGSEPAEVQPVSPELETMEVEVEQLDSLPATIGDGVFVSRSGVPGDSGNGLYAGRPFRKGTIITEYSGTLLSNNPRSGRLYGCDPGKCAMAKLAVQTHVIMVQPEQEGSRLYIAGLLTPRQGAGGGSFTNHSKKPTARVEARQGKAFLIAISDISLGDEIFMFYGKAGEWPRAVAFGEMRLVPDLDHDKREYVKLVSVPRVLNATRSQGCLPEPPVRGLESNVLPVHMDNDNLATLTNFTRQV